MVSPNTNSSVSEPQTKLETSTPASNYKQSQRLTAVFRFIFFATFKLATVEVAISKTHLTMGECAINIAVVTLPHVAAGKFLLALARALHQVNTATSGVDTFQSLAGGKERREGEISGVRVILSSHSKEIHFCVYVFTLG